MARKTRRLRLSLLSAALSMTLILCMFPTAALAADQEISLGGTYNLSDFALSAGDTLTIKQGLTVTLSGSGTNISIVCEPDVNLTINGVGITVTTPGYDGLSPIAFTGGTANTLTIVGDSSLTAQNNQAALRVEGSTALTINGSATLHTTSFQGAAIGSGISADSGTITITGGNIDAQAGSNGAGIGGGGGRSNGTVNITGGTVYASSGLRGAGIGGGGTDIGTGGSGGIINISGGDITALGIRGGAGIGGGRGDSGNGGYGGIINITGGKVTATTGEILNPGIGGGAGIGGGYGGAVGGAGGVVTITNEANVSAKGSVGGYDMGGGGGVTRGTGGTLSLDGYAILRLRANGTNAAASVNTGTVTGASGGPLSGAYFNGAKLPGEVIDWGDPYLASGAGYTFDGSTVVIASSGDYAVVGKKPLNYSTITVNAGLTANIAMLNTYMYRDNGFSPLDLQGDLPGAKVTTVTMTLYGDTEMITNDRPAIWLNSNSVLTIQGSGKLTATSSGETGIGSSVNNDNGRITIKGGTIIAAGGGYSAGIGGSGGDQGDITIEGGNVTATGGSFSGTLGGAGIGGGTWCSGGNLTITGGTVTATGGAGSAGIGGGSTTNSNVGNGGTINISGGIVNATGGTDGAGIGGGKGGSGGTINLSGGSVYADGANSGQDIGCGASGSGGTVSISGSAAVFLARDNGLTPTTTTHTHRTHTDDVFGYTIPGAWMPTFGAYLRVYTLSYNVNGGAGTAPSSVTKLYQNTISIPSGSGLVRNYYTFLGWNTAADGSGTGYDEGDTFDFTATTTLFAQWVPESYTITYDLGGGTVNPANPASYTVESGAITLRNPVRAGYTFAGWSGTDIAGTSMSVTIPAGSTGNRSFTANWTAIPTYIVTFNSNGSVYTTKTVNAGESIGNAAWPADPTRNSYTFGGWFTAANGAGTQFTSATPVNATTTVYAKWTYSGGGGGGGGNPPTPSTPSTPTTPTYYAEVKADNGTKTTLPITVNKGDGTAALDMGSQELAPGETVITIPAIPDVGIYSVGIPVYSLSTPGEQSTLTLNTDAGSVTVPSNMLSGVEGFSGSKAAISIGQAEKDNLPDEVKANIGDRPLIQLTLYIDGKQADWSNPNSPVTVSIPYTPTAAERLSPESIVIWYIDGSGNVITIPNGRYDPATGMVTFNTTHFSNYAVAYNKVNFSDIPAGAWYNKAVSFIAAREITTGTGNGNYSPGTKLTRGEFIVLMMNAYGIAPVGNPTGNFADAGSTYYTGYLAAAKQLGISGGVGNNMFAPGKEITRQEMFTLLYNTLKAINQLPQGGSGKSLSDFTDAGQIDAWAKDAMTVLVETGTIGGSNGKLNPLSPTTRAEMAQVLYNLLSK